MKTTSTSYIQLIEPGLWDTLTKFQSDSNQKFCPFSKNEKTYQQFREIPEDLMQINSYGPWYRKTWYLQTSSSTAERTYTETVRESQCWTNLNHMNKFNTWLHAYTWIPPSNCITHVASAHRKCSWHRHSSIVIPTQQFLSASAR